MRRTMPLLFLGMNWLSGLLPAAAQPATLQEAVAVSATITGERLYHHLAVLGSDSLEGRGTGTRGGEKAAAYLAQQFRSFGLLPAGDDNTYFQQIPMHASKPLPDSKLQLMTKNGPVDLVLGADYLLYNTGAQTFIPKPVPLVFVGYGIIAPEYDYNDYQALNVVGKIVVFLSGEPYANDFTYFEGEQETVHALPEVKQKVALSRGAVGSIMIPSPRHPAGRDWQYWLDQFAFEDVRLFYSAAGNLSVVMNPAVAGRLFDGAAFSLAEVLARERVNAVHSFTLPVTASFRGSFQQRDFLAANVIALLPGSDPELRDTYVLVSAHYDHLGMGPAVAGDSIYNGVFDNAAGVAAVLEIARAFAGLKEKPRRSLLFVLVTGEEKGLLGSTYYVDHPVKPLYRTIANLNVDGLAMFDTFADIVGVGAELSTLGELLHQLAGALHLKVSPIPSPFADIAAFGCSDQVAFARGGIPALLIMEGMQYHNTPPAAGLQRMIDWGRHIYHSPCDDLRQAINRAAMEQHTRILFAFCHLLANLQTAPEWKKGTPYRNARLQSLAEKR
ncbi:MAG: M20/M25/M40 family metallo-hydrolase [candidate division KSB1 bacterium]|nr:M20/M25/M40 family metallo-hydrolase [candidate division KSB1 bacterium]MDZ7276453.1 M20/M25/M40 family metallo-hydrolase [candidate division KSB1 bacterium]MDZ7288122.1 M20/M25/M40 family metallo-hydrolase [candidate division KSB1 bacterium]MDZ7300223.1 M20/M25/M40 family metallo-hydrolase [candidate division KSB1 bacterium]MDZ7309132.1 M20/M25/M40 family metallo-hydrolase [candidate division KSB1 bacterium]